MRTFYKDIGKYLFIIFKKAESQNMNNFKFQKAFRKDVEIFFWFLLNIPYRTWEKDMIETVKFTIIYQNMVL